MKRSATKTNRGGVNLGSAFFCIFFLVSGTVILFLIYQALGEYKYEKRDELEGASDNSWAGTIVVNEGENLNYSVSGNRFRFKIVDPLGEILVERSGDFLLVGEIVAEHSGLHHVSVWTLIPNERVRFSVWIPITAKYSIWDILSSPTSLIFLIAGISCIVLGLLFLPSIRT